MDKSRGSYINVHISAQDEEDWNEWTPNDLDQFTEIDKLSIGRDVTENQSPLFDSSIIKNIKKEDPDFIPEVTNDVSICGK